MNSALPRFPTSSAGIALLVVLLLPERLQHGGMVRRTAFAAQVIAETAVVVVIVLPG
ncbi:hypothetical protein [Streptomyces albipurpureus]|uniref:Uncharacterized protein n=1 Tax=Streptomyces albipurpureus TaxID=2897419 RepID=A0ABT0UZR9_9ACTN|nr:hypothetical protein [Streptomyces sp. CWNU-1]MCM2393917.1 hypothetical protein [Streptomyces sp. CWNU-1]